MQRKWNWWQKVAVRSALRVLIALGGLRECQQMLHAQRKIAYGAQFVNRSLEVKAILFYDANGSFFRNGGMP